MMLSKMRAGEGIECFTALLPDERRRKTRTLEMSCWKTEEPSIGRRTDEESGVDHSKAVNA